MGCQGRQDGEAGSTWKKDPVGKEQRFYAKIRWAGFINPRPLASFSSFPLPPSAALSFLLLARLVSV